MAGDDFVDDDGTWRDAAAGPGDATGETDADPESAPTDPPTLALREGDYVDESGTWVGSDANSGSTGRSPIEAREERRDKHFRDMQRKVLVNLGWLILIVFFAILVPTAAKWIDIDFAKTLIQAVMAPLLAAAAVVIGYFFGKGN